MILWGEEEQRNERAFHACVETSDMELVTTRKEDDPTQGRKPGERGAEAPCLHPQTAFRNETG